MITPHFRTLATLALGSLFTLVACPGSSTPPGAKGEDVNMGGLSQRERVDQLYEGYRNSLGTLAEISVEELLSSQERPIIVDVREDDERAVSIIPGAISRKAFEARKDWPAQRPIVVYCTIGLRSGKYVKKLSKRGIASTNLQGSILAWVNAGGEVVDPQGKPTKRVHVYGEQWNVLPDGYEAVW